MPFGTGRRRKEEPSLLNRVGSAARQVLTSNVVQAASPQGLATRYFHAQPVVRAVRAGAGTVGSSYAANARIMGGSSRPETPTTGGPADPTRGLDYDIMARGKSYRMPGTNSSASSSKPRRRKLRIPTLGGY